VEVVQDDDQRAFLRQRLEQASEGKGDLVGGGITGGD
jgi:hypothetical protein